MLPSLVGTKQKSTGFTLIELMVAIFMAGILATISAPVMFGFVNRSKLTSARSELFGALEEVQRQAIRRSINCRFILPSSPAINPTFDSDCFVTGDRSLEGITLRHNGASVKSTDFLFDFRGRTSDMTSNLLTGDLVLILTKNGNLGNQKCVIVSRGLGLVRSGNYPSGDSSTDSTKCVLQ
ncbi:type II secretion system protein [Picosynechococcus sp. PCC 11901]|uniref:pilus assembly FimT family protein n=1 Tax=Picosynechococcus sp. PCC 11901 TaxID=2579791 RepID=UPI0010FBE640|nr:type II secretion system protein [Picosynechococcus sp. PCC 11901]QCS50144.1 type II secretion system protein [Picosynechococcus sp. PCC 11901]